MRLLVLLIVAMTLVSCEPNYTAQQIVDKSITHAGLDKLNGATVTFDFRDKFYKATRNNGTFELRREFIKDSATIVDVLSNTGFQRTINDSLVVLSKADQKRYGNAVNSVHYFSVLPYGLNDKAVYKKILPEVKINDIAYYKLQITFSEEDGGDDFDDVFIYWFRKDNFQLDYLAYKYHTNGGGVRFRELKEQCIKNGIRFVDYHNYKPTTKDIDFFSIDKAYEEGKLKKVSEIVLKNIEVLYAR